MKKIEIKMPALKSDGSPIMLCRWGAQPGDRVETGDVLFEAEAAKTVSEIEADAPMRLTALLCEEGDEVEPGTVIATAEVEAETE
jgi:pyruvate/2-oxoglutarate dehydrogenase complex dihydrolipoamide acyltransferase (E2) component